MSEASSNKPAAAGKRRRRRLALRLMLIAGSVAGVLGVFTTHDADPAVSSEWPRPYDPAKPFNMLGVPGVSVEQRKRAEDLLLRSLQEAHRWSDYEALVNNGWYHVKTPQESGFVHIINIEALTDDRMLDPLYPETLLYRVREGQHTFVAYMYMATPGMGRDHPDLKTFAGRLIEWHDHSNLCFLGEEGEFAHSITGFLQSDGSCDRNVGGPRPIDAGLAMTHVWVVERACGPFSALEGAAGVSSTPTEERVDICEH